MCSSTTGQGTSSATTSNVSQGEAPPPAPGPDGWPARSDVALKCAADGASYDYYRCTSVSGLCKGTLETCTKNSYRLPSSPPPAEWPCVVK